ncbi:hypothetical protein [Arthrobacter zhaoguopingii]|uniref:hypothetical protein n=1 Tax=Arthrobacter zhaoguopingii TaxID=2681491 RepID=UPI00135A48CA|nr:hypothetical protein [Arthrobacter zhaoguopingii]
MKRTYRTGRTFRSGPASGIGHRASVVTEHGRVLLVVDQPATIGALPVAVAQTAGVATAGHSR